MNAGIPFVQLHGHGLVVYVQRWLLPRRIFVMVEIAGDRFALGPAGDAHVEREFTGFFGFDDDFDAAVPRIAGLLRQFHRTVLQTYRAAAADKEIHVGRVVGVGVDVAGDGREEANDVHGTAGGAEP